MKAAIRSSLMALAIGSKVELTPVQKVVQLMVKMLEKGNEEKHSEQVQYAAHKRFCDDTTIEKRRAIAEAEQTCAVLKADSQKYKADTAHLSREISELDEDISLRSSDIKAATNMRHIEKTDHDAVHTSYSETNEALLRAIAILKEAANERKLKQSSAIPSAPTLREITVAHESAHEIDAGASAALPQALAVLKKSAYNRQTLASVSQVSQEDHNNTDVDGNAQKSPDKHLHDTNSTQRVLFQHKAVSWAEKMQKLVPQSVVVSRRQKDASWAQVMKKLIPDSARKAIDVFLEQGEYEAEDLGSIWHRLVKQGEHDYEFQSREVIELLEKLSDKFVDERVRLEREEMNSKQDYDMLMQDLEGQISQATNDRGQKVETKGKKLRALSDAVGDLKDATSTMQTDQKYISDLTSNCQQAASAFSARQQLRAAELSAIERAINIISGNAVAGNAEKHLCATAQNKSSFAQLRSSSTTGPQDRVAKYLQGQAAKLNSLVLASVATHVSEDPFAKVHKMLKDLIVRLAEGEHEEAEHQGWCHVQLSTNEQTRNEKTNKVETLQAEIDQLQASISKIMEHINDFSQAVAEIDSSIVEAAKLRKLDKSKNMETMSDAQEAQNAIMQALQLLKQFYAKADKSVALARPTRQQKKMFGSPYKGMQSETSGVMGMLEVIQSDFARLESETRTTEVSAQKEYDEFKADSKVDRLQKSADIERKISRKSDASRTLTQKTEELESAEKDLNAAMAYFDKLKPSCIESGFSYEDRAGRRKREIESLQIALRILNGADVA